MKDDLISRKVAMEYLDKRRTYELMDGRNKAYGKGIRDAIKDIEAQPSAPAVPLDKLCEFLGKATHPCILLAIGCPYDKSNCEECDSCNAWEAELTKWMEKQNA